MGMVLYRPVCKSRTELIRVASKAWTQHHNTTLHAVLGVDIHCGAFSEGFVVERVLVELSL